MTTDEEDICVMCGEHTEDGENCDNEHSRYLDKRLSDTYGDREDFRADEARFQIDYEREIPDL